LQFRRLNAHPALIATWPLVVFLGTNRPVFLIEQTPVECVTGEPYGSFK
jgi:hypothetical protein